MLKRFRDAGDRAGEASVRYGLAEVDRWQANYESAQREYGALLELFRALGDRDGEAATQYGLSDIGPWATISRRGTNTRPCWTSTAR